MSTARYKIMDEPAPGGLARLIVEPFWPLLACMMVGTLPGLAWLAFNGFALGSPSRMRELLLCLAGLAGALLIYGFGAMAIEGQLLSAAQVRYLMLLAIVIKLGFGYMACFMQQRAMELHEYYGGGKANGLLILVGAIFLPNFLPKTVTHGPLSWLLFS